MAFHSPYLCRLALLLCSVLIVAGCAGRQVTFVPPDQRPLNKSEQPWPHNHYLVLAYHDIEDQDPDQTFLSVRTDHLVEQFSWLRDNGYQPVSIEQILAAKRGGPALPNQAVLLSFDDGYRSFYTRVLPLLRSFQWPALLAPVGTWVDTPDAETVNFGGKPVARNRFLTWSQIVEISRSGLVEIGAHTDALHYGIPANPQGNEQPAAAIRKYDPKTGAYESQASFEKRLREDVKSITQKIEHATGKPPRVWVWPYGEANGRALEIVRENGYQMSLTLENSLASIDQPMNVPRLLIANDPPLGSFARAVINMENKKEMRVAHVDLDYVYDADPKQMERNLDQLVQRVANLGVNTVFLQAFADPEGDGLVRELYFPNRHLPVRADLFNRAAWQLRSRAFVEVYAWMPVLSFELDPGLERVTRWYPDEARTGVDPDQYVR
ncbi:MAG TPA: poly-beta-1,6-N-acetyl-D-glucosamine N-deacetylase PgaB, partial [Pusillimonas sp.]|uniref:poly-beta-1,6-N-acetyl-D-glucosamine N-deacetylase PgaB n=1 Tax=Pusillimonas sp. TaxID=3040095 RepID=UPI002C598E3D